MNVSQLITQLEGLDPDLEVYLSSDEEGNDFKPLTDVEQDFYYSDGRYESHPVHPNDIGTEYDKDDLFKAVTLWP